MLAGLITASHREILTSDAASGSGVLDGRTSDALLGGTGRLWVQDSPGMGYQVGPGTGGAPRITREAQGAPRRCALDVGTADVDVRWLLAVAPSAGSVVAVVRGSGPTTSDDHLQVWVTTTGIARARRVVDGVTTAIASDIPITPPVVLGLHVIGDRISVLVDGAVARSITDGAVPAGGWVGWQCTASAGGFELGAMTIGSA